jgi:hypothetical protein
VGGFGGGLSVGLALGGTPAAAGGSPDGSSSAPWQATGSDVAAVQSALAALSPSDGDLAWAAVTGGWSGTLQYDDTDGAWYAPGGGDGSELAPYWTATAPGSGALASLPPAEADAWAVIGKGGGTPLSQRGLNITSSIDGYAQAVWVPAAVYALGAPDAADVSRSLPTATEWTLATTGTAGAYTATGGRVVLTSGSTAAAAIERETKGAATILGVIWEDAVWASVTTSSNQGFAASRTSSDSGQGLFIGWGGSTSPGGQTTKLNTYNGAGAVVDTGVTFASATWAVAILDVSTNAIAIYADGAAAYTGTSIITSGSTPRTTLRAQQPSGLTWSFRYCAGLTWT